MLVIVVNSCNVAHTRRKGGTHDAAAVLIKLECFDFLSRDGVPNMDGRIFTLLSSDDLCAILGNVKAQNVVSVTGQLISVWCTFLFHFDFSAAINFLRFCLSVKDNTAGCRHEHCISLCIIVPTVNPK